MESEIVLLVLVAAFLAVAAMNIRRIFFFMVTLLILVTPIANASFMPREVLGITGLNVGNIIWLSAFATTFISVVMRRERLHLSTYFSPPLMVFIALYWLAAVRAALDLGSFKSPTTIISHSSLIFDNGLKPVQILLSGWIVMIFCEIEGNVSSMQRVLYFVSIIIAPIQIYFFLLGGDAGMDYAEGRDLISSSIGYHANELGAVGTFLLVFALITPQPSKEAMWRIIRYVSISASFVIIAVSFSRTAYVTTVLLGALTFFKLEYKERLTVAALAGVVVLAFSAQLIHRISFGMDNPQKGLDLNEVSAGRTEWIWLPLVPRLYEHVVVGDGLYSMLKTRAAKDKRYPNHPHNSYLQVALDMGLVGMISLVWMLVRFLRLGRQNHIGFSYVVICWMMTAITGAMLFYPTHMNFIVWVCLGFALSVPREEISELYSEEPNKIA